MSVTKIEKVSSEGLQSVYKVIVPADIVEQTIVERAREIGKNFKMHGFRPGHVPLPIIRNKMKEDIHRSTLEKLISDSCSNITKDAKIEELAVRPTYKLENSFEENKELVFTLTIESAPIFELKPYDFEISKIVPNVPQSDIEEMRKNIMATNPLHEDAEEGYVINNLDSVKYKAIYSKNGKLDASKDINSFVVIPQKIADDDKFLKQVLGKKVHESFEFIPDDKQKVKYQVTIEEVKKAIKNITQEEYALKIGFKNIDEWNNAIKASLESQINSKAYLYHKSQIIENFTKDYSFDLPKSVVAQETQVVLNQVKSEIADAKQKGEEVKEKSDDEIKNEYLDTTNKRVMLGYIFNKIARKENIVATDDEVNQSILVEINANPTMADKIIEYYRRNQIMLAYRRAELTERKVVSFLMSNVKTKDEPKTLKEVEALVESLLADDEQSSSISSSPVEDSASLVEEKNE